MANSRPPVMSCTPSIETSSVSAQAATASAGRISEIRPASNVADGSSTAADSTDDTSRESAENSVVCSTFSPRPRLATSFRANRTRIEFPRILSFMTISDFLNTGHKRSEFGRMVQIGPDAIGPIFRRRGRPDGRLVTESLYRKITRLESAVNNLFGDTSEYAGKRFDEFTLFDTTFAHQPARLRTRREHV